MKAESKVSSQLYNDPPPVALIRLSHGSDPLYPTTMQAKECMYEQTTMISAFYEVSFLTVSTASNSFVVLLFSESLWT